MNDDVRRVMYGTIVFFVVGLLIWFGFLYINACGFTLSCNRGQPAIVGTPIPTVGHAPNPVFVGQDTSEKCQVAAVELLGAWVTAGSSETETFTFTDVDGNLCEGTYAEDVRPLFVEANIWYPGSFSCASCHNADIGKTSAANLDLTTYQGMLAGSQRAAPDASGTDILGSGSWESSLLYQYTFVHPVLPPGHAAEGPTDETIVFAGRASQEAATAAPTGTSTPAVTTTATP